MEPIQRPLRDPVVVALFAVTILVFAYQKSLGRDEYELSWTFGAVPDRMWAAWHSLREGRISSAVLREMRTLVTANFLHADLSHIGLNMLFFWVFGNVVCQAVGRWTLPVLYLLAGVIAVIVHVRMNPESDVPMIGASGAIAGLEGAYFIFLFRWELPDANVWPLAGPVRPGQLGVAALLNFFMDASSIFGRVRSQVAFGAHVGGFLGGALLALLITSARPALSSRPRPRR